jgi:hypothetical protein
MIKIKANHKGSNLVNILQYQLLCFVLAQLVLYPHNSHLTSCAHKIRTNIFLTNNRFDSITAEGNKIKITPSRKEFKILVFKEQFNSCTFTTVQA